MPIIFVGDLHSAHTSLIELNRLISAAEIKGLTHIFQVGDLGVPWQDQDPSGPELWNREDRKWPWGRVRSCLGNHDDWNYWSHHFCTHNEWPSYIPTHPAPITTHFWAQKRSTFIETEYGTTLFFGGAESSDCYRRKENLNWWPQESPTNLEFLELMDAIETHKPRFVVAHEAPLSVRPFRVSNGKTLSDKPLNYTPQQLERLFQVLEHKPEFWMYGHHHLYYQSQMGPTQFWCCGANGQAIAFDGKRMMPLGAHHWPIKEQE